MKKSSVDNKKMSWVEFFVIALFAMYFILPSVSQMIGSMMIILLIAAYIGAVYVVDSKDGSVFIKYVIVIAIFAFVYLVLTDTKTISESVSNRELKAFLSKFKQYILIYLPLMLFWRAANKASRKQQGLLLILCAVLLAYVVVQTLQVLAENPGAIRHWEELDGVEDENIGSYYFVYAIPLIIVCITSCLEKKSLWVKALGVVAVVFLFVFLLEAQYTLALLIATLGLMFQVFLNVRSPAVKMIFVTGAILLLFFIPDIINYVATNIASGDIAVRLKEINTFFTSGNTSGYNLSSRLTLYGKTIEAFLNSPIWGNRTLDFDGHATFLTVLADTGIIGAIPFYGLLFSARKRVLQVLGEGWSRKFTSIFFCYVCMGLTNPVHNATPLSFSLWFIAPMAIFVIFKKEKQENEQ